MRHLEALQRLSHYPHDIISCPIAMVMRALLQT